jgi:hypothetical protein
MIKIVNIMTRGERILQESIQPYEDSNEGFNYYTTEMAIVLMKELAWQSWKQCADIVYPLNPSGVYESYEAYIEHHKSAFELWWNEEVKY